MAALFYEAKFPGTPADPATLRRRQFYNAWLPRMAALEMKRQPGFVDEMQGARALQELYAASGETLSPEDALRTFREQSQRLGRPTWQQRSAMESQFLKQRFRSRAAARMGARQAVLGGDVSTVSRILGRQDVERIGEDEWKIGDSIVTSQNLMAEVSRKAEVQEGRRLREMTLEGAMQARPPLPQGREKPFEPKHIGEGRFVVGYDEMPDGTRRPIVWDAPPKSKAGTHTTMYEWGLATYTTDKKGKPTGPVTFLRRPSEPTYTTKTGTYINAATRKEEYGLWAFESGSKEPPMLVQPLSKAPEAKFYYVELEDPSTGRTRRVYGDLDENREFRPLVDAKGKPLIPAGGTPGLAGRAAKAVVRSPQSMAIPTPNGQMTLGLAAGGRYAPLKVPVVLYRYPSGGVYIDWAPDTSTFLRDQAGILQDEADYVAGRKDEETAKKHREMAGRLIRTADAIDAGEYSPAQPAPMREEEPPETAEPPPPVEHTAAGIPVATPGQVLPSGLRAATVEEWNEAISAVGEDPQRIEDFLKGRGATAEYQRK